MAQPSGRICGVPSRYRLYFSSSPILCAADALSAIIRLITTSICFRISPLKACQLVVVSRFEINIGTQKDHVPSTPFIPPPPPKSDLAPVSNFWPRYLFFVMGTLPSAIKLASFTGNPWTKAWGFMFPASFAIIEVILLLSKWHGGVTFSLATDPYMGAWNWSVPNVLGLSWEEWLEPQNKHLHTKTTTLRFWLRILDLVLYLLAFIAHTAVLGWVLDTIWRPVVDFLDMSDILQLLSIIALDCILVGLIISICVGIGMCCLGYNTRGSLLNRFIGWCLIAFCIWTVISPDTHIHRHKANDSKTTTPPLSIYNKANRRVKLLTMPWFYLAAIYYASERVMAWIGERWPAVIKALLAEQTGWEQVKEFYTEQITSEHSLNTPDDIKPEVPVDDGGFFALFFFLASLGICLRWYAVVYDPTGTVNPAWTDIFGR